MKKVGVKLLFLIIMIGVVLVSSGRVDSQGGCSCSFLGVNNSAGGLCIPDTEIWDIPNTCEECYYPHCSTGSGQDCGCLCQWDFNECPDYNYCDEQDKCHGWEIYEDYDQNNCQPLYSETCNNFTQCQISQGCHQALKCAELRPGYYRWWSILKLNENIAVFPTMCGDNLDNDCDGEIDCLDSDCFSKYDADFDGYYQEISNCDGPFDCDDTTGGGEIYPGAIEICDDNVDNNCDNLCDTDGCCNQRYVNGAILNQQDCEALSGLGYYWLDPDPACTGGNQCNLTSAYWNQTSAVAGDKVLLKLTGTDCSSQQVNFTIYEFDGAGGQTDYVTSFIGTYDSKEWTTVFTDDSDSDGGNSEYYFRAFLVNNPNEQQQTHSILSVSQSSQPPSPGCVLTSAHWNATSVEEGTLVELIVIGDNCSSVTGVVFDIGESDDIIFGDYAHKDDTDTSKLTINRTARLLINGQATAYWIAEWVGDEGGSNDNSEYVFKAWLNYNASEFIDESGKLSVTKSDSPPHEIIICANYTNPTDCDGDIEHVGNFTGTWYNYTDDPQCWVRRNGIGCEWDDSCEQKTDYEYDPNNHLDCSPIGPGDSCIYSQSIIGNCADGDEYIIVQYTSTTQGCDSFSRTLPCVGQIALPFFGIFNFIITLVIVGFIYLFLVKRKKFAVN